MLQHNTLIFPLIIFLFSVNIVKSQCNVNEPHQDCAALYRTFRDALFANSSSSNDNLFILQSVFYPATQITPVLVKVRYKLNELPVDLCHGSGIECPSDQPTSCNDDNFYTFGWTTREIYRIFHPSVINRLRFQLPFWLLQISEDIQFLTEEFDVDALLWDGASDLPSINITLDVNLSSSCKCPPKQILIKQALGELTHWLRAFAKVAISRDFKTANPEDKGIALHCTSVEIYNSTAVREGRHHADAQFGELILYYSYSIGFVLALMLTPVFIAVLLEVINKAKETAHYRILLSSASTVCFIYSFASIGIAFYQLTKYYSGNNHNQFDAMKASFLSILVVWVIILSLTATPFFKTDNGHKHKLAFYFSVLSISIVAAVLILSFPPTVILLFAYPLDTSALLTLHIALFYSTSVLLAIHFGMINKWINYYSENKLCCPLVHAGWFFQIMLGLLTLIMLPLTYICIIFLYQFVIIRSDSNQINYGSDIVKYIPTIFIGLFGYALQNKGLGAINNDKQD